MNITVKKEMMIYDNNENLYHIPAISFPAEYKGLQINFTGASGSNVLNVILDSPKGKIIAVASCVAWKGNDKSFLEIEPVCGTHDIYLKTEGHLKIEEITFFETSPFDKTEYEAVSDDVIIDTYNEHWEATDELGRRVRSAEDVRGKGEKQRLVGIFYWSWRNGNSRSGRPVSVAKVLDEFPGAEYNIDHPAWKDKVICSWNEPLYGHYKNDDPYVIRHHAILLAAAGVDFIVFDCTNGSLVWREAYEPIFEGFRKARLDGINVPKIAFMLNLFPTPSPLGNTERMIRGLYQDLYKPGRYSDLWFMLDGKPFIMAYKECVPTVGNGDFDTAYLNEIHNFFTFRAGQPSYGYGATRPDFWGWLEKAPQHKFGEREDGTCEMMTVGVAQNCNEELLCTYFNNKKTFGRSYTYQYGHDLLDENSYKYGFNFQEQWDRAIDIDPDYIFITGWNEWIMGQWKDPWVKDPNNPQIAFVDQFDREHSRDIEPDRDSIRDTYYMQLASNIRRYKGARRRIKPSKQVTIENFDAWNDVYPKYENYRGSTIHRDFCGFGDCYYKNYTGRNDIISAKVARDDKNIYFFAECSENIIKSDKNCMTLFINTDRKRETGWEGYDFVINRIGEGVLETWTPLGWKAIDNTNVQYNGKAVSITVPRDAIGLCGNLDFEFKWSDNMQTEDPIDFYENGCTAPTGRFNYRYKE